MLAAALLAGAPEEATRRGKAPELPGARAVHEERSAEQQAALDRLSAELAELQGRIERSEADEPSLLSEVNALDLAWALARAKERAAQLAAAEQATLARAAGDRATALALRLEATRARVIAVLQAMHRSPPRDGLAALLAPAPAAEASGDADASILARRHVELARELGDAQRAAEDAAAEAASRAASAQRQADEARDRGIELARQGKDRTRRLRALAADRARARQLEEERALAHAGLLREVTQPRVAPAGDTRSARAGPPVDLPGLDGLRGRLPWPLAQRGKIVGGFGDVINPRHGTRTLRHGIVVQADEGTPILAIAAGRAVFVDWFKGFGRCLVLDHGDGWLSVQAHARAFDVRAGDDVAAGQVVGEVGDSGSLEGPRLHFQLTRAGEPVDPLDWLER